MEIYLKDIFVKPSNSIEITMKIIQKGGKQIAIVVNDNFKMIGTVTDGDIRRGLLKGLNLNDSIESIFCKNPIIAKSNNTKNEILEIAISNKIHQIPIVDDSGKVISLKEIDNLVKSKEKTNKVVLMVGGLGKRLWPLTENLPKPMLKVGTKSILQIIIERFAHCGYRNIVMCVNYKSNIIQDYFGSGKKFGVNIEYVVEEKRMGTVGALSLLKKKLSEPFFVMNGDVLTNVDFESIHNFYLSNNANALMCVREYSFQVPYGIVNIDKINIVSIKEKPIQKFFINAGIYMFNPEVLKLLPNDQFIDMPVFFEKLINNSVNIVSFPLQEYWLDIGIKEEYEKGKKEIDDAF